MEEERRRKNRRVKRYEGALLTISQDLLSLPFVLTSYPTLTTVDLTDSSNSSRACLIGLTCNEDVGDAGAKIVAEALAANMTVTALGLSGNKI
eukprot:764809-Hanusia_phi.AAC.3